MKRIMVWATYAKYVSMTLYEGHSVEEAKAVVVACKRLLQRSHPYDGAIHVSVDGKSVCYAPHRVTSSWFDFLDRQREAGDNANR